MLSQAAAKAAAVRNRPVRTWVHDLFQVGGLEWAGVWVRTSTQGLLQVGGWGHEWSRGSLRSGWQHGLVASPAPCLPVFLPSGLPTLLAVPWPSSQGKLVNETRCLQCETGTEHSELLLLCCWRWWWCCCCWRRRWWR